RIAQHDREPRAQQQEAQGLRLGGGMHAVEHIRQPHEADRRGEGEPRADQDQDGAEHVEDSVERHGRASSSSAEASPGASPSVGSPSTGPGEAGAAAGPGPTTPPRPATKRAIETVPAKASSDSTTMTASIDRSWLIAAATVSEPATVVMSTSVA